MTQPDHVATTQAVYDATAQFYAQAVGTEVSAAFEGPLDRAILVAFAELVVGGPGRVVVDVGCGTGRVSACLAVRGIDVVGVDASRSMLTVARAAHPTIGFAQGLLTALPLADRSVAGAVCWYSIIHTPPDLLDAGLSELKRILAPDGHLLVAFQAGNGERVQRPDAYGTGVTLHSYRHSPEGITRQLTAAGFDLHAKVVREPEFEHESTPQAFLLARPHRSVVPV